MNPLVIEKTSRIGGMGRTFTHGAHRHDCGAHRFHDQNPVVTDLLRSQLGIRFSPVQRPSCILDRGQTFHFPPSPRDMLLGAGLGHLPHTILEFLKTRGPISPPANFQEAVESTFGPTLASRFLLPYTEKLWGLPGHQLSPRVATARLSGFRLREVLAQLRAWPGRPAFHIEGSFLYPATGIGEIVEAMASSLGPGSIVTRAIPDTLLTREGRVIALRLRDGRLIPVGGPIISTMPLPELLAALGDALPDSLRRGGPELRFRALRLVFLVLDQPGLTQHATIYFPSRRICFTRVSEPRNRSPAMAAPGQTGLLVEVPCFEGDHLYDLPARQLVARVLRDLVHVGLLNPARVLSWSHHLLPHAYPVQSTGIEQRRARILDALSSLRNLHLLGRSGRFLYGHLHDQVSAAARLVSSMTR